MSRCKHPNARDAIVGGWRWCPDCKTHFKTKDDQ